MSNINNKLIIKTANSIQEDKKFSTPIFFEPLIKLITEIIPPKIITTGVKYKII